MREETEIVLSRADYRRTMMMGMAAIAAVAILSGRFVVAAPDLATNANHRHRLDAADVADRPPHRACFGSQARPFRSDCRAVEQDAGVHKSPLYDAWSG